MTGSRNILVFGRNGQVATELRRADWPADYRVGSIGRAHLDLSSAPVETIVDVLVNADTALAVNAAAYTAVDRAEDDRQAAFALNADAPGRIAQACALRGVPLIHLSTDYVFDGAKSAPYVESDKANPLSVYGASKLAGEAAVAAACDAHVVLRTAWVFSPYGANFVKTMLRLGAEREKLTVVDDQRGSPTSAADIARALVHVAVRCLSGGEAERGTFHFTAAGHATRYDFAGEIFRQAGELTGARAPRLAPVKAADHPAAASRPANSVLDCSKLEAVYGVERRPWQDGLKDCLAVLLQDGARGAV